MAAAETIPFSQRQRETVHLMAASKTEICDIAMVQTNLLLSLTILFDVARLASSFLMVADATYEFGDVPVANMDGGRRS